MMFEQWSEIRTRTVENIIRKKMHKEMLQVHLDILNMVRNYDSGDIHELVREGYFYDYGILDNE